MLGKLTKDQKVILLLILFHIVLAFVYGGNFVSPIYPDTPCYVSSALNYLGYGSILVPEFPPVLLYFIAFLYVITGFYNFLSLLWIWNVLIMAGLIVGTYYITKKLTDEKTAIIAAMLVTVNWHIGWYGHQLMVDIGMAALVMLSFSALIYGLERLKQQKGYTKFLLISGILASMTMWTKYFGLVIIYPLLFGFIIFLLLKERYTDIEKIITKNYKKILLLLIIGIVLGQLPILAFNMIKFNDPLLPLTSQPALIREDLNRFEFCRQYFGGGLFAYDCGPIAYGVRIPYALGIPLAIMVFAGFVMGLRWLWKKEFFDYKTFIFLSTVFVFLVYSFRAPIIIEQYMTHFTPWLIMLASIVLASISKRVSRHVFVIIMAIMIITTASSLTLFVYDIKTSELRTPLFLPERLTLRPSYDDFLNFSAHVQDLDTDVVKVAFDYYGTNCELSVMSLKPYEGSSDYYISKAKKNYTELFHMGRYYLYNLSK